MYGAEMMEWMEQEFEEVSDWSPSSGSVYPILKRLANQGYLSYYKEDEMVNSKKFYRITPTGRDYYKEQKKKYDPIFKEAIQMLKISIKEIYGE